MASQRVGDIRALVVYPAISLAGFDSKATSRSGEARWISHGVASLVTYARGVGHDVRFLDLRELRGWDEFTDKLKEIGPDIVGVSVSYLDYRAAQEVVRKVKKASASITVVAGGILPSNFPTMFLNNNLVDHTIMGEGEITFVELLQALERGVSFPRLARGTTPKLDSLPFVDREIFDYRDELDSRFCPGQETPMITMIAGRGCPFKCTFCQPAEGAVFSGKFRMRSPENIIAELECLRARYAFRTITWWDDTFTIDRNWIEQFCALYRNAGFTASMTALSRPDIVCKNEGMITQLAKAGLNILVVGFESGSQRLLDFLKKGTTVKQNLEAARICRRCGIAVYATAMLGLPTETREEATSTVSMLEEIRPDVLNLFYFNPIPGTEIYQFCQENKLILKHDPFDISRTGDYRPKIRGIDYPYLDELRERIQ